MVCEFIGIDQNKYTEDQLTTFTDIPYKLLSVIVLSADPLNSALHENLYPRPPFNLSQPRYFRIKQYQFPNLDWNICIINSNASAGGIYMPHEKLYIKLLNNAYGNIWELR